MRRRAGRFLVILSILGVSGCTQASLDAQATLQKAQTPTEFVTALKAWKKVDLDAATARATVANHRAGMMCYPVLAKYLTGDQTLGDSLKLAGVFDAFEAGLLIGMGGQQSVLMNPVVQDIHDNCAALVGDANVTLIRLGIIGAGGALR